MVQLAIFAALCVSAFAAEEPIRSKRQLLTSYVASPYASYVSSPYVAASPYVSASYVAASPYNGGAYYNSGPVYAPAYASAYYSPYAYL